ncbi:uncharacterized protein LOC119672820 [Teleopsis dalmanni]|uniref:uncharacterized protein LOC119672820 n=1 Tax=Teleopsis dalmanni TaxID=139649 RepID=UPI0018CFA692|nr:uncharacterized protein LOC119672820 [Teleopsis dalmanni]
MAESEQKFLPGLAIIVNQSKDRAGSSPDVYKLIKTFEPFNIDVLNWSDWSEKQIRQEMKKLQLNWKEKYNQFEYVCIVHLSHGFEDETVAYDKEEDEKDNEDVPKLISIQKLLLNPLFKIKELNGKLKWIIVQACRGSGEYDDAKTEGDIDQKYFTKYFLKCFATSEGAESYRVSLIGAIFIDKFCEQFTANAGTKGILDIMADTKVAVQNYFKRMEYSSKLSVDNTDSTDFVIQQVPAINKNFAGDFYLDRGFDESS